MSPIKLNALQTFLLRPDADAIQAQIKSLTAAGHTRAQICASLGLKAKLLLRIIERNRLLSGELQPNCECDACGTPLRRTPDEMRPRNYCDNVCKARGFSIEEEIIRSCKHCGKSFSVPSHGTRTQHCTYECSVAARTHSIFRRCETCDDEMGPLPPGSKKKFCDKQCSGKSMEKRVVKTCVQCGTQKEIRPCHDRNNIFCCSNACILSYRQTNPEYKAQRDANISAAILKKWTTEKVWAKAQRLKLSKRSSDMIKAWGHDKPSSAEAACMAILDAVGITYETQHQVYSEKYGVVKCYDLYLPSLDVLVEVHGTFWHADPRRYPDRTKLSHTQKHNLANDKIKADIAMDEIKKRLVLVWEEDLSNAPETIAKFFMALK